MNLKLSISAAALSMAFAGGASAASVAFTMPLAPATPYNSFQSGIVGSFVDYFNFTAPSGAVQSSAASVSIDLLPFFNIDNLQLVLFNGSNGTGSVVPGGTGGMGEFSQLENIAVIAGNAYSYRVTGTVVGAPSGAYTFTAVAAPIPEPETYALMFAGLGIVGFVAARRRSRV